jgi:CBS domain-containing protein
MRVSEFMTSPAVTVTPETTISEASSLLLERGFSAVPVVDEQQRLVGILSEADLLRGRVGSDPRAHLRPPPTDRSEPPHTVGEVMTRKVLALPQTADEAEFANAMLDRKIKSIPVVGNDRVVGIVAVSDLLRARTRGDDQIARDVGDRLREYAGGRDIWSVSVDDGVVTISGRALEPQQRIALLLAETVPGAVRVRLAGDQPARREPGREAEPAGGVRVEGPTDHRGLRVLSLERCVERLRQAPVGRLAFIHDGDPVVLPVNHGLDELDVVFRTTWGSKLQLAQSSGPVAFEVDGVDENRETGWSVLVKGTASIVYESSDLERLERLGVGAWAGVGDDAFWVRIRAQEITGREVAVGRRSPPREPEPPADVS